MTTLPPLDALMTAINRLTEVMDRENAALRQRDWKRVAMLAGDKRSAIHAYESALQELEGAGAAAPTEAEHALVHAASERLAATEENERRLAMVIFAQRRVIAAISEAVIAAGNSAATYGRTGGMGYARKGGAPIAVAINGAF